jgi:hypothetical protein
MPDVEWHKQPEALTRVNSGSGFQLVIAIFWQGLDINLEFSRPIGCSGTDSC